MAEHVKWLGENWPGKLSIQPNAGLPELVNGQTHYPLMPDELAQWQERFATEDGVHLIGGGCRNDVPHIPALDAIVRPLAGAGNRPRPQPRRHRPGPRLSQPFGPMPSSPQN